MKFHERFVERKRERGWREDERERDSSKLNLLPSP
jgi:hypothetical protein